MLRTAKMPSPDKLATGVPYYLPKGLVPIMIEGAFVTAPKDASNAATPPADRKFAITVTAGVPKLVADPEQMHFLEYNESSFADDTFDIKVDSTGLLQTADLKSKDESGAAAVKLVELLAKIAEIPVAFEGPAFTALGVKGLLPPHPKAGCNPKPFKYELSVDPEMLSPGSIEKIEKAKLIPGFDKYNLANKKIAFTDEMSGLALAVEKPDAAGAGANAQSTGGSGGQTSNQNGADGTNTDQKMGVLFRAPSPYWILVSFDPNKVDNSMKACNLPASTQAFQVMVPNDNARLFREDTSRAALVEKHLTLTIEDGMLREVKDEKPSQVLQGLQVPIDIVNAILAIPEGLLTLRIDQVKNEEGLTEAQVTLLKQEIESIKQQQALKAARAPVTP